MNAHQYPSPIIAMILLALTGVTAMAGALVGPILPLIDAHYHDTDHVSMLLTLPALGVIFTGPFIGRLTSVLGKKPLLLLALALYVGAGSTGLWLESLNLLLAGRFALGVAMAVIMTLTSTYIADLSTGKGRDKLLAHQSIAIHIGAVTFICLSGHLAQLGWRIPFAVYLLPVAILVAVVLWLPASKTHKQERTGKISLTTWRSIAPYYALVVISMSMFYFISVFYPFLITDLLQASSSQVGNCIAVVGIVAATASLLTPRLASILSTRHLLSISFACYAAGHFCLATASSWPALVFGGALIGTGLGFALPSLSKAIAVRSTPANRAILMSGFVTSYYLGQFISPMMGKAMTLTNVQSMYTVSGAFMLTLAIGLLVVKAKTTAPADA